MLSRLLISASVLVVLTIPLSAGVAVSDFESGANNWTVLSPPAAPSFVSVVGGTGGNSTQVLQLYGKCAYTWEGGAWSGDNVSITMFKPVVLGADKVLTFDAYRLVTGTNLDDPQLNVAWAGGSLHQAIETGDWHTYSIDLTGVPDGTAMTLGLNFYVNAPSEGGVEGVPADQIMDVYLDNVQFVPEPATLMLLAGAAIGLVGRRNRG